MYLQVFKAACYLEINALPAVLSVFIPVHTQKISHLADF